MVALITDVDYDTYFYKQQKAFLREHLDPNYVIHCIEWKHLYQCEYGQGVYVIFAKTKPIYIGQTTNLLRDRFSLQHSMMPVIQTLLEFDIDIIIAFIPTLTKDIRTIEQSLIKSIKPRFNAEGKSKKFAEKNGQGVAGSKDKLLLENLKKLLTMFIAGKINKINATNFVLFKEKDSENITNIGVPTFRGFLKRQGIYDLLYTGNKYKGIDLETAKSILDKLK